MSDSIEPYLPPEPDGADAPQTAQTPPGTDYRPWTRARVYVSFILGMHAAGFMMSLHPVLALFALGFGIPAVLVANKEIEEYPQAAAHPFIHWGRLTGKIGIIGGPILAVVGFIVIIALVNS
jgi:hypothetical protein